MLRLVLRKLFANRWLTTCLLAGFTIGTAVISGIPMYTAGILQRMLTRDLELLQESRGAFPGRYSIRAPLAIDPALEPTAAAFAEYDRQVRTRVVREVGLPVLAETRRLTLDYLQARPLVPREEEPP